jgi:hypothetical protein
LKGVEPYEVVQALSTGRMVRRWMDDHVVAVVSSTVRGRVLVVALYEETLAWVIIGARAATADESLAYYRASMGGRDDRPR